MQDTTNLKENNLTNKEKIYKEFTPQQIVITDNIFKSLVDNCIIRPFGEKGYWVTAWIERRFGGVLHRINLSLTFKKGYFSEDSTFSKFNFVATIVDRDSPFYLQEVPTKWILNSKTFIEAKKFLYDKT